MELLAAGMLAALALAGGAGGAGGEWRWPERATSVRIDTKVKFVDDYNRIEPSDAPAPFQEAHETAGGFYSSGGARGRFPVRSEPAPAPPAPPAPAALLAAPPAPSAPIIKQNSPLFDNPLHKHLTIQSDDPRPESDGTLDSIQSCRCSNNPHCLHVGSDNICGEGQYLCCFKKSNNIGQKKTEFFNEEEDERPELLQAGGPRHVGPFPPPPNYESAGEPAGRRDPHSAGSAQRPVLVGPGGATGVIGPRGYNPRYQAPAVLVGPGGPTGMLGPPRPRNRGVLIGPGGPTGIIGPRYGPRYGRRYENQPGLLVGPGGPTGIIGPGRHILVGPDGPTGIIGPDDRYDLD